MSYSNVTPEVAGFILDEVLLRKNYKLDGLLGQFKNGMAPLPGRPGAAVGGGPDAEQIHAASGSNLYQRDRSDRRRLRAPGAVHRARAIAGRAGGPPHGEPRADDRPARARQRRPRGRDRLRRDPHRDGVRRRRVRGDERPRRRGGGIDPRHRRRDRGRPGSAPLWPSSSTRRSTSPLSAFPGCGLRGSRSRPASRHAARGAAIGHPEGGSLAVIPASVAATYRAAGRDLYGGRAVDRAIVEVRGDIQPGDSGGPLMLADGTVGGVVFAERRTDPAVGYALAVDAVSSTVLPAVGRSGAVPTGPCVR